MAQAVGALNQAAGLREPSLAASPVISVTGGPEPGSRYRFLYQQVEDFTAFDPVTKLNIRIERSDRVPDLVRQAFRVATSGTPGPVHLELPGRLGEAFDATTQDETPVEPRFASYPPYRPVADGEAIAQAVSRLAAAERPVIIAGGGVGASSAGPEVVALAEAIGVPVGTSLNGKDSILDQHRLGLGLVGSYGRWSANEAVAEADLVMFIGSRAGGMTTENWKAPRVGTAVIQLDIDPATVGLNYPVTVGLVGDARETLRAMLAITRPEPGLHEPWLRRCSERTAAWRHEVEPQSVASSTPIRPERLCRDLQSWLPEDGVVVADTGHIAQWSGAMLGLTRPSQRYLRCAGTLGWALPGAIGVKCALPDRPVVCLTGDGGIYYHIAELETAARQGINAIVVINNNGGLLQTKPDYDLAHGDDGYRRKELWEYRDVDFAAIARQFGCEGIRVHHPDEFPEAMDRALGAGRPTVVDVVTDPTAFPPKVWRSARAPGAV
jgi:acetolactate synthase-1/2/3 large subunit